MEMNSMRALEVDYTTIRPQLIQGLTKAVADGWTVNGRYHHPFGIYRQAQPSAQVDGIAVRVDPIEINNAPALILLNVADDAYWKIGRICLGGRFRGKSENNASSGYHCQQNSRHVGASLIVHLRPGSADFASHLMPALPQKQQVATRPVRRRCCSFGRECGRVDRRGDHGHLSADQIGHQCRCAIISALEPVVLDRHVLAFDVARFVEAFAEANVRFGS